jgi:hypothetical protein
LRLQNVIDYCEYGHILNPRCHPHRFGPEEYPGNRY